MPGNNTYTGNYYYELLGQLVRDDDSVAVECFSKAQNLGAEATEICVAVEFIVLVQQVGKCGSLDVFGCGHAILADRNVAQCPADRVHER